MEEQNVRGRGALDAFLNLFSLITLGWMSISIGVVLFQIIDKLFGSDKINYYSSFSQEGLKMGIASALIITPIFLFIITSLHKHYKNNTLNSQSGIYRWLTYLVLLITALNIIGRLIQLIFQFLNGDYTLVSILKILVVLAIAGGIFGYYWYDLKRSDYSSRSNVSQIFFWAIIVIFIVSVVGGFLIIDSPKVANMKQQDRDKVGDLNNIHEIITREYMANKQLPIDLSAPKFSNLTDYDYKKISENKYELCTTFALAIERYDNEYGRYPGQDWDFHNAGHQCFEQIVSENPKDVEPIIIR
jgi:hypothetical protein